MKNNHSTTRISFILLFQLLTGLAIKSTLAQTADSVKNIQQFQPGDTTGYISPSPKKVISEIVRSLVKKQQFSTLSYNKRNVKYRIEKDAEVFKLPGGDSRALVVELPAYTLDYILTIRSMVHGIGFKFHIFSPTGVFLDSSFRPTHLVSEKQFIILNPASTKALRLEAEVVVDTFRKEDKYLLIYTLNKSERLGTYDNPNQGLLGMLKHPVERSKDGRLEIQLHLR